MFVSSPIISLIFTTGMAIFRSLVAPGQPVQLGVGGAEGRQQGVEAWLVVADVVPAHGEVGAVPRLRTTALHQDHLGLGELAEEDVPQGAGGLVHHHVHVSVHL